MTVVLVATLRDEGPYLLEWLAHHRAAGVDAFLLFTNDCGDGTDRLCQALAPAGVTHVPNPRQAGRSVQWQALRAAWAHPICRAADWILGLDIDEFVNLRDPGAGLAGLIAAVGDADAADAIVLPWRLFGHAGHCAFQDRPILPRFTRAAPADLAYPASARSFKTLFRAKGPFQKLGVHRPKRKPKAPPPRWVDGAGRALPSDFAAADGRVLLSGPPASDLVQLNHYPLRAAESFLLKRLRGLPNRKKDIDLTYWVERNFNTVEDRSILAMAEATAAERARLMALPGVADLHAAAVAQHRARLKDILQDPDTVRFLGRLMLAGDSAVLPPEHARALLQRYRAADG